MGGNAFTVEKVALRDGMSLAWTRGYRSLECNSDCVELVEAVEDRDKRQFFVVISEILNK